MLEQIGLISFGAVFGLLLSLLVTLSKKWLWSPNVEIRVGESERFVSRNPVTVVHQPLDKGGRIVQEVGAARIYIRVEVKNYKRPRIPRSWFPPETVRGCNCYLADLKRWDDQQEDFIPTYYADCLRLTWSHIVESKPMDLLLGILYYLDVCFIEQTNNKAFFIATKPEAKRYDKGFSDLGYYRFTLQLSGENIDSKLTNIYLNWVGNWQNIEIMGEAAWQQREKKRLAQRGTRSNLPAPV